MADPRLQAQLDAAARQQGFRDYGQWSAWQARQREMRGPAMTAPGNPGAHAQPRKPAPKNWFQQILTSLGG